ncbi:MAG: carbon-nitrogen hydrolase family protein [Alphaproteobacteria bacterium]
MTVFSAAAVQMRAGIDPAANTVAAERLIRDAAADGASYVLTPEMTTVIDLDRKRLLGVISDQDSDPSLRRFRELAEELAIVLHIGSMPIRLSGERVADRGFLIGKRGELIAIYDKIHMYDVDLGDGESYRESALFTAGNTAVVADVAFARLGLSICYDLRFPHLFRALSKNGAQVLAVPSAFTRTTGEAHWDVLLRARAIENGAYVIAAAQGGHHEDGRATHGHSMIIAPWGEVLAELGTEPGFITAEIDVAVADRTRRRIPALRHDVPFEVSTVTSVVDET